jgi:hypothetical protein
MSVSRNSKSLGTRRGKAQRTQGIEYRSSFPSLRAQSSTPTSESSPHPRTVVPSRRCDVGKLARRRIIAVLSRGTSNRFPHGNVGANRLWRMARKAIYTYSDLSAIPRVPARRRLGVPGLGKPALNIGEDVQAHR